MKTSGDRNGAGSSQEPPPFRRTESRVQKLRRNPRPTGIQCSGAVTNAVGASRRPHSTEAVYKALQEPMENPCNTKRSGCTRSSDQVPKPHPEWSLQEAIPAASNTVIGIPVLDNALNECGNIVVYGCAVEYAETMMKVDSEGNSGNVERLEIPLRPSEELPLSNVSIFSGGSGNLPTSSPEIKNFFIETLPLGPARFSRDPGQNFLADYRRGPIVDPYGNPIHPGDNFPRRAYGVRDLNVDMIFPTCSAHTVGGGRKGAQSTGVNSLDTTMSNGTASDRPLLIPYRHPILFVDAERTFDISAAEDMLDASESGMPYIH
ncbi:hypothetical protein TWF106_008466 [Orbilia oligospora]|uniref:Uncharacterized protein n=1 Tax=Orbilia oligospora TaxID=2813651 RepID=A0A6G1MHW6_ORBOL|nr:hypothetical protein TWF788_004264 [Orbilia oligospora]KAF3216290.1 hypothetical protein TWF106_008466 [Orbilia oligospora]KAF3258965.1 hypothetical protein TWF192_011099 [Orbilia oligospora]